MLIVFLSSWYKMVAMFWALSGIGRKETWLTKSARKILGRKILFYTLLIIAVSLTKTWKEFLIYWVTPYLLIMPVIERLRSISEHFGLDYGSLLGYSRNVLCSPIEAFFLAPHNIRFHMDHHLFPSIPQYNLPKFHSYLMTYPEFSTKIHNNNSYFFGSNSVLSDLIRKQESQIESQTMEES
jgi:fatty acid desaturase